MELLNRIVRLIAQNASAPTRRCGLQFMDSEAVDLREEVEIENGCAFAASTYPSILAFCASRAGTTERPRKIIDTFITVSNNIQEAKGIERCPCPYQTLLRILLLT